ncbi:MAG: esterase family protein [Clostridiales bacterium]|nr:esterase family protein [Clostridiales bacterium]
MTFTDFHYFSDALGVQVSVYVLMPEPKVMAQKKRKLPCLYLLHGLSDDHTMWMRQTRLEYYARKYRTAIVMPAVNRSFYTDMVMGAKYFTFVSEELPQVMETYFPISSERKDRFAAGLSMGGYGAMKLGLRCPDRYAAIASFSGALEMEKSWQDERRDASFRKELDYTFGGEKAMKNSDNNLARLARRLCKTPEDAPRFYVACGTEDFLFEANNNFIKSFGKKLNMEYHTEPGAHTWDFWDKHIEKALAWFDLPEAEDVW